MTEREFRTAARSGTPVRLKDRCTCFYQNEWYRPVEDGDGKLRIHTHTGETRDVGPELLDSLRTPGHGVRAEAVAERLREAPALRVVLETDEGEYIDICGARTETIAIESQSEGTEASRHGTLADSVDDIVPTETVLVLHGPDPGSGA